VIGNARFKMQDSKRKEIEAVTFWISEPTYTYYYIRYKMTALKILLSLKVV
jgi:hypothetical protein